MMYVLSEAGKLLSSPQGSLVYHLLLLWALWFGWGMARGEWRRSRQEPAHRLLLAMGGLLLLRIVYVAGSLFASGGRVDPVVLLPPLEHAVDAASLALLAWAYMPPAWQRGRLWDQVLGAILLAIILGSAALAVFWSRGLAVDGALSYNGHWQAIVGSAVQLGLAVLAIAAVLRSRPAGWGTLAAALLFAGLGAVAQLSFAPAAPHLPVWQRLANLVAYPLIAIAVYQQIIVGLRAHSREMQDISQASLDQIKSLLYLFEASQQTSSSLDMPTVLDNAVRGIARVLGADQCAIAFPEESNPGQMRLVAIHNPTRQGRGEAVAFPLEYQLTVQQAVRRRKYVIVEESDNVQLKVLFALLGSGETGPLLVQPLIGEKDVIGAIIVGNSRSRRPFTPNEAKLCQSMAEQAVTAIENARRHQAAQRTIQTLTKDQAEERRLAQQLRDQLQEMADRVAQSQGEIESLAQREAAAREARNALEIRLVSSRAEADTLSERLSILESDLAQAHANAEARQRWHEQELEQELEEWAATVRSAEATLAILQGMTAGVLVSDAQGLIQESNVAAEILLDRGAEELQGAPLAGISDQERWLQALATAGSGEAVRLTLGMGDNVLMCDVAPLPDPQAAEGDEPRLVVILQDISDEVRERRGHMEATAALAEELRTPVTTIINYAEVLLGETMGLLGDAQRRFVLQIKSGAESILQMAGALSAEAEYQQPWSRPQTQPLDVNQVIQDTVAGSQVRLEDKALTVDLQLGEDLPAINADPDYMRCVLDNLLSNACLASGLGGQIEVQTSASQGSPPGSDGWVPNGDRFVVVSVRDSGGGLSDEALGRVFDRARPSRVPRGLGESGAGLSLVKTLVEVHGGRLWVESEKGVGTTFRFVLPIDDGGSTGEGDGA
ncbi:MAG: ATP-binding protein [Anaerolineae bacterium]|nr:ATP-binding protein [Anaerolineae bacterium]